MSEISSRCHVVRRACKGNKELSGNYALREYNPPGKKRVVLSIDVLLPNQMSSFVEHKG